MTGIFLKRGDALVAMREAPYPTESVLQELIATHPQILAGDDGDEVPGSWLLVRREATVYDEEDAASRGSLDHLFIDADGVPTLVEVKRASDTRIRREVVGQMLDYAANARHWTVDKLTAWLEERCEHDELDAAGVLGAHVDDVDRFWEDVHTNLAAGRMRLVFVADEIPSGLRRIIEFLNLQMTPCEVIGIEVRQYLDDAKQQTILVPRVLGQLDATTPVKGPRTVRHWNRASFVTDLEARSSPEVTLAAHRILQWGDGQPALACQYGHGAIDGSAQFGVLDGQRRIFPFVVYTNGFVEFPFERLAAYPPFADQALREQYRLRLNAIDGIDLAPDAVTRRPSVSLEILAEDDRIEALLAAAAWALAQQPPT